MNKKPLEKQIEAELEHYFDCAKKQKCPKSMKKNLYQQIAAEQSSSWSFKHFATVGLSLVFVSLFSFKLYENQHLKQANLEQAQFDLEIAMHYINQVSLKSLSAVNNNGIKPGLIKPLARTYASL